jgi:hypothetical protein
VGFDEAATSAACLPACLPLLPACLCCLPLLALLLQECQAEIGRLSKRVRELQEEASCQLPLALRTFLLNCLPVSGLCRCLLTATACTAD